MRTINIIPESYDGNPREALGYSWAKLVMTGYRVDREKSLPGDDIIGGHDTYTECLANLEKEHGKLTVVSNNSCKPIPDNLEPVASINCMWCGGSSVTVYAATFTAEAEPVIAGSTLEETAAQEYVAEKIELAEIDEQYKNHPGYCTKCHSFCYGDCEAQ